MSAVKGVKLVCTQMLKNFINVIIVQMGHDVFIQYVVECIMYIRRISHGKMVITPR